VPDDDYPNAPRFCSTCGGSVARASDEYARYVCASCGVVHYLNPKVSGGVIVVSDGRLLLVRRAIEPYRGQWNLPAGYVEYEESTEQAAMREAREEAGVDVALRGLHGVYSCVDDPRARYVLVIYRADIVGGELTGGDDVDEARFFPLDALPAEIAFDGMRRAIRDLER
jgi:ADP-ribose pyrophosphatase YjhB (NUDIX family)